MLTEKDKRVLVENNPEQIFKVSQEVALELVEVTPLDAPMNEVAALNALDLNAISGLVIKLWKRECQGLKEASPKKKARPVSATFTSQKELV